LFGNLLLGALLSLTSAAFFGMNATSVRRGVLTGTVLQGLSISFGFGLPFFILMSVVLGSFQQIWNFSNFSYALLVLAGLIHFGFGRYCNYRATKAMGGLLVRPLQQISVILSLFLATMFLGETLTPIRFLGIFLILLGPLILLGYRFKIYIRLKKENIKNIRNEKEFNPNYKEGFVFAMGSAFGFGASPVLVRGALVDLDYTAGVAGGVVSYAAAAILILIVVASPVRMKHVFSMSKVSAKWFSLSAFFISVSQMLRYMALAVAPVSIVAPIQQTSLIFQVLFSWFINRDHESFSVWVLVAIFSSFIGAVLVSLSTDFIMSIFDFPEDVETFLLLSWP